jgi:tubulin monoglycylase TTLL15
MWSLEYPYDRFPEKIANQTFDCDQKLNHFPGVPFLTNKRSLSLESTSKFIPQGFSIPEDLSMFDKFTAKNPTATFVLKNFDNRGVKIVTPEEIRVMELSSSRFVQVFVDDPFLVHGHAFDLGVYVLITSLEPLTIYRFTSECLLRFCPEPYFPFDANDTRKYVVADDKLKLWDFPQFQDVERHFSHIRIIEDYFESKNLSVKGLWANVDEAIVTTAISRHELILNEMKNQCRIHKCTNDNFFELLRFDFVVKSDGDVRLMEVNMSPNMTPSNKEDETKQREMLEQVVFNALRMFGAEGFAIFRYE